MADMQPQLTSARLSVIVLSIVCLQLNHLAYSLYLRADYASSAPPGRRRRRLRDAGIFQTGMGQTDCIASTVTAGQLVQTKSRYIHLLYFTCGGRISRLRNDKPPTLPCSHHFEPSFCQLHLLCCEYFDDMRRGDTKRVCGAKELPDTGWVIGTKAHHLGELREGTRSSSPIARFEKTRLPASD